MEKNVVKFLFAIVAMLYCGVSYAANKIYPEWENTWPTFHFDPKNPTQEFKPTAKIVGLLSEDDDVKFTYQYEGRLYKYVDGESVDDEDSAPVTKCNLPGSYTVTITGIVDKSGNNYELEKGPDSDNALTIRYSISRNQIGLNDDNGNSIVTPPTPLVDLVYNGEYQTLCDFSKAKVEGYEGWWTIGCVALHAVTPEHEDKFEDGNMVAKGKNADEYPLRFIFHSNDGYSETAQSESGYSIGSAKIKPKEIKLKDPKKVYEAIYTGEDVRPEIKPEDFDGLIGSDEVKVTPDNFKYSDGYYNADIEGKNLTVKENGYMESPRNYSIEPGIYQTKFSSLSGADRGNYTIVDKSITFAIKKPVSISWNETNKVVEYNGEEVLPKAEFVEDVKGLALEFKITDENGTHVDKLLSAGTYYVTPVLTGVNAGTYKIINDTPQKYVINPMQINWKHKNENPRSYFNGEVQRPEIEYAPYSNNFLTNDKAYFTTKEAYREAGDYIYTVIIAGADAKNYELSRSGDLKWTILKRPVNFNVIQQNFTYDGTPHKAIVELAENSGLLETEDWYVTGDPQVNVGDYTGHIEFKGKDKNNYTVGWTVNSISYKITPKPLTVNLVRNKLIYSGAPQLPEVKLEGVAPVDEGRIKATLSLVAGDDGMSVGTHYAKAAITGDEEVLANYIWNDAANPDKVYSFEIIEKSEFEFGSVKQSENATPGSMTTLSYNVEGSVYEYWIKCNSCRAFNTDTIPLNGSLTSLDIFIPDTVKPGRYDLAITFRSEDYDTTKIVQLRVDYPATDIYIMWKNILAIDNSDDVFKTYQWYKNGEQIPGATRQYYQDINGIEGYYCCLVNGEFTIGPAYFHSGKPLWIKTKTGVGSLDVEVVGTLPAQTILTVYNHTGMIVTSKTAEQINHFDLTAGIYFVNLTGKNLLNSEQSVKVLIK